MKRFAFLVLFTFVLGALTGCSGRYLTDGFYQTDLADRPYYAAVYKNRIFLQLERPSEFAGSGSLWVWAGKYTLRDDNDIELDLPSDLRRDWNYSYSLQASEGGIQVTPLDTNRSFWLRLNKNPQRVYQKME